MMLKKRSIRLTIILLIMFPEFIIGQVTPPPLLPPPPPGLPIDSGVLFLIIGGVIYGLKKIEK